MRCNGAKTASAEKLNENDLERHREIVEHLYEARRLQHRAAELLAAGNVWAQDLARRYGLDERDHVLEDGTIIRRGAEA